MKTEIKREFDVKINKDLPDKWKDSTEVDEVTAKKGSHEALQSIQTEISDLLSLYHLLEGDYTKRMTWVKNKLPWYMSAFHKLSSSEIFLDQTNIFIGVSFGKQIETKCYVRITPKDIGWKNCEDHMGVDT